MEIKKVDFAIITILPEEYEAIHKRFAPYPYTLPSTGHTYGISHIQTKEGRDCTVAIARTSRPANDASQQLAHRMINDLNPQMLLVVGIGGGIPDTDFTLGDVIVSSNILNFNVNAVKGDETAYDVTGGIHPAVSNITANLYLYQSRLVDWSTEASIGISRPALRLTKRRLARFLDNTVDEAWCEKVEKALLWHFGGEQRGAREPKFLPGTIASSNTLVRSDAILVQWLQDARSIRAVEMEVAGVYQAAQHIRQQYPVMAIRGISDIIGFKRDDHWKLYSCHTAAAFAYAFIAADISESWEQTRSSSDEMLPTAPISSPIHPLNASLATSQDTGLYLSPQPIQEKLWSNLLKVTYFPEKIYTAYTNFRSPNELIAELMTREVKGHHEWLLKNKQIVSFYNLGEPPWRDFCDIGTIEYFDSGEWAYTEDTDRKREFVWLLNQALQSRVWPVILYSSEKKCYYVRATPDLSARTFAYQSLVNRSKKTVFRGYQSKNDPKRIAYYRHSAFEGQFRCLEGIWYLEITPTYYFTSNGRSLYTYFEETLKGIKLLEHNPQVLSHVIMWADYLSKPADLFTSRPRFLEFGHLMSFSLNSGIDEKSWLRHEEDNKMVGEQSALEEFGLFGLWN